MGLPELEVSLAVTLTNSDWLGEQVKVQKMLKKLSLQAGQEAMIPSASFRFFRSVSTCSSSQHTSVSFHRAPHNSTSLTRTASVGVFALPLSGQGRSLP